MPEPFICTGCRMGAHPHTSPGCTRTQLRTPNRCQCAWEGEQATGIATCRGCNQRIERGRYPRDWKQISHRIRFERAQCRCECEGECGRGTHLDRCPNKHGQPAYGTGSRVVLTTAHLNHTPEDCRDENLKALCQACHLAYDREHHAQTARQSRTAAAEAQMESMF